MNRSQLTFNHHNSENCISFTFADLMQAINKRHRNGKRNNDNFIYLFESML